MDAPAPEIHPPPKAQPFNPGQARPVVTVEAIAQGVQAGAFHGFSQALVTPLPVTVDEDNNGPLVQHIPFAQIIHDLCGELAENNRLARIQLGLAEEDDFDSSDDFEAYCGQCEQQTRKRRKKR